MYKTVHNTDLIELENEVNSLLASKWELAGNLVIDYHWNEEKQQQTSIYIQPMRKR